MAPKNKKTKKPVEIDLSALGGDAGLVLLRDSDYAMVFDRLPLFLPRIDKLFGGGLPFGRMIEIAGKPAGGKSTISFHIARVAAMLGCIVVLVDVEGTADRVRLAHLGIDVSKVLVKQPDEKLGVKLTVEEVGTTIETTLAVLKKKYPNVPVVFIWDSVGGTPSKDELGKDFGEKNVGARAKAITQFITKVAPQISETKSLLIGINQVRADIGGNPMFPTMSVPGGMAWEHYASLRLEIQKKAAIKKGTEVLGHTMGVKVNKSKVSRPFQAANGFLISDNGLDYEYNIAKMAEEDGILASVGGNQYYEYTDRAGATTKKRKDDFIAWLSTPEGQLVRQELLNKLIVHEYPDGNYPALANESLELSGWMDEVDLAPYLSATAVPTAKASTDSLVDQVANEIVNGE